MYNLIVSGARGTWDEPFCDIDVGRFLEHTDPNLVERLKDLPDSVADELKRIPTLFAYEIGVGQPARIGWLKEVRKRQGIIRIGYKFDQIYPPITTEAIGSHVWEFDINKNEMYRTHWAVKDVDLIEALNSTGLGKFENAGPEIFKFSRRTIIEAAMTLKRLSHAEFDRLLLEFGIHDLRAGRDLGGLQARANAVAQFAIENPTARTAEGEPIGYAIVRQAVAEDPPTDDPILVMVGGDEQKTPLWQALENDGIEFVEGKLRLLKGSAEALEQPPYRGSERDPVFQSPEAVSTELVDLTIAPTVFKIPTGGIEADLVGVMMPLNVAFDAVYEAIKAAGRAAGLACRRADDMWEDTVVMQDIFSLIYRSRIVVVDFTDRNPNVFYEAGIAHALGRTVVPITQNKDDVPFDLRHHRYLHYLKNGEGLQELIEKLSNRFRTLVVGTANG